MNCRGVNTRIKIAEQYDIKLIAHTRLLNGQTKRSDAEAELKDQYYVFQCTSKNDDKIVQSILCGTGAAKHFLELMGEPDMPLFDPIRATGGSGNETGCNGTGTPKKQWNDESKQLYNAIQWLIICWDIVPKGAIIDIKEKLEHYYYKEPFLSQIKAINTIISKGKKTLSEMINELRATNDIKEYNFDLLQLRLAEENIKSNF
ncbi:MAG: hypothetical protein GX663_00990 [Clostridiales bacterium]|nr:hypothetical protein [Clostridiales bacterium]